MAAAGPKSYTLEAVKALPANVPSICIPRVFPNITWQRVKSVFEELDFGTVEKVDMVNKTAADGTPIKRVFVHISAWNNDNPDVLQARHDILNGEFVEVTYDQPWFWRCYQSNVPRPAYNKSVSGTKKQVPKLTKKAPKTKKVVVTQANGWSSVVRKSVTEMASPAPVTPVKEPTTPVAPSAPVKAPAPSKSDDIESLRAELAELKALMTNMAKDVATAAAFPAMVPVKKPVASKLAFREALLKEPVAVQSVEAPVPEPPIDAPRKLHIRPIIECKVDDNVEWGDLIDSEYEE